MNMALRKARLANGLTQAELAQILQLSLRGYQRYEYGERNPDIQTAGLMAAVLGQTVEALFLDKDKKIYIDQNNRNKK